MTRTFKPHVRHYEQDHGKVLPDSLCAVIALEWEDGESAKDIARTHGTGVEEILRLLHLAAQRVPLTRRLWEPPDA